MIDLDRINRQQTEKNREFANWLLDIDLEFAKLSEDPKIEPYLIQDNADFSPAPLVAMVSYPKHGSHEFYLCRLHFERWRDPAVTAREILSRLKRS
jgi:hypothetical protein